MSGHKVESVFPHLAWRGHSDVHRSVFVEYAVDHHAMALFLKSDAATVLRVLRRTKFHEKVGLFLDSLPLGEVEWLVAQEDLHKLCYYLVYKSLTGSKPKMKETRILNASTGNVFIPIFVRSGVVAGIRFWAGFSEGPGIWRLGFRVRFVSVSPSEEQSERLRTRLTMQDLQQLSESIEVLSEVTDYAEVAEPLTEEEGRIRVAVRIPGG